MRDGQRMDLHAEMMKTTLHIVAKTLFDADVESDLEGIGRAMDVTVRMFTRTMTPWGPWLNRLPLPSNFRFRRAKRLFDTIDRFIREHRESGNRGDLLSVLIRARDTEGDDGPMSAALLRDESHTIFTAGHETTANALTFALYLLAKNPAVEKKLHEELDTVLGGRAVTTQDVEKLEYSRMVIAEAMRLYPPAWAIGREVTRKVEIGGYKLPAKSVILVSQWTTHRDERWFPRPEEFDPSRWTDDAASNARAGATTPSAADRASASAKVSHGWKRCWSWPRSHKSGGSSWSIGRRWKCLRQLRCGRSMGFLWCCERGDDYNGQLSFACTTK